MPPTLLFLLIPAAWLAWSCFAHWLLAPNFRDADCTTCLAYRAVQIYARLLHRLRIENQPASRAALQAANRPLVVVANHTAGVDPILIQAALPFEARWMMGEDMRLPVLAPLWEFLRIIFVSRTSSSSRGVRDALKHLKSNQVLGVFPEGHIERPAGALLPFQPGAATLIKKTAALVLPVCVSGTPQIDPAWASLWKPSRSRLLFLPVIDYARQLPDADPQQIADDLRLRMATALGSSFNEQPPVFEEGEWKYPALNPPTSTTI